MKILLQKVARNLLLDIEVWKYCKMLILWNILLNIITIVFHSVRKKYQYCIHITKFYINLTFSNSYFSSSTFIEFYNDIVSKLSQRCITAVIDLNYLFCFHTKYPLQN